MIKQKLAKFIATFVFVLPLSNCLPYSVQQFLMQISDSPTVANSITGDVIAMGCLPDFSKCLLATGNGFGTTQITQFGWYYPQSNQFITVSDNTLSNAIKLSPYEGVSVNSITCSQTTCYAVGYLRTYIYYEHPWIVTVFNSTTSDFVDYNQLGGLTTVSCPQNNICYAHGTSGELATPNNANMSYKAALDYWLSPQGWAFYISQATENGAMLWSQCNQFYCLEKTSLADPGYAITTPDGSIISNFQPQRVSYLYNGSCGQNSCVFAQYDADGQSQIINTQLNAQNVISPPIQNLFATGSYCTSSGCFITSADNQAYYLNSLQISPTSQNINGIAQCSTSEQIYCLVYNNATQSYEWQQLSPQLALSTPLFEQPKQVSQKRIYTIGDSITYILQQVSSGIYPTVGLAYSGSSITQSLPQYYQFWFNNQQQIFANEPANNEIYANYGFWDIFDNFTQNNTSGDQQVINNYMNYLEKLATLVANNSNSKPQNIKVIVASVIYTSIEQYSKVDEFNSVLQSTVAQMQNNGWNFSYCPLNEILWPGFVNFNPYSVGAMVIRNGGVHENLLGAIYMLKQLHTQCGY